MHQSTALPAPGQWAAVIIALAAAALTTCGMWLNFHGAQVMVPGDGAMIVAWAAVAAEVVKLFWMTGAAHAWRRGRYAALLAVIAMGAMLHAFSLVCAIGIAADGRNDELSGRVAQQEAHQRLEDRVSDAEARIAALSGARPVGELERLIADKKQHKRWRSTGGCTNATVPRSIAYCREFRKLEAELKDSRALAQARADKKTAEAKLDKAAPPLQADPQAAVLADYMPGATASGVSKGLPLLPSLIVEIVPVIAFWLACLLWPARREEPLVSPGAVLGELATPRQIPDARASGLGLSPDQRARNGLNRLAGLV